MVRHIVGLVIILVGFVLLLNNFGITTISVGGLIKTYWPLILIFFGVENILGALRNRARCSKFSFPRGEVFVGVILVALGFLLLLKNLGFIQSSLSILWKFFWPAIFILIGLTILRGKNPIEGKNHLAVMGGVEIGKTGKWDLVSDSYLALMGGIEMDLRQANLPEGETLLDITAFMGGVEIIIPPNMPVICEGSAVMGGIEFLNEGTGGIISNKSMQVGVNEDTKSWLRIQARAIMGGIEVKMAQ